MRKHSLHTLTNGEIMGMDHLVKEARSFDMSVDFGKPKILVVGCGGAGNNSVDRLMRIGVHGAQTVAINTDKMHIDRIEAEKKALIGRSITRGMGAGGCPEVGERCALLAEDDIRRLISGADMTFITVGMGGGTGTGVAPVVARLAESMGSVVVAIATTPFDAEKRRCRAAKEGLEKLRRHCDSVIVLDNNRLVKMVPSLPIEQAFCVMDQLISEVIRGITETITLPSLINLDFADVKTMMSTGQTATILYGEECADDPEQVIVETLNNPLLDIDYSDASGALIHLTSGPELSIGTAYAVVNGISSQLSPDANVIFGARVDENFAGVIRVLSIITGVHSPNLLSPSAGQVIYDDEPLLTHGISIVR
ncbi:MAG: cell division protein FtsZ, partial [Thermoplasmata archaeon]|nr:cell division protein FtsZ [Thermoplasmata archaeon]